MVGALSEPSIPYGGSVPVSLVYGILTRGMYDDVVSTDLELSGRLANRFRVIETENSNDWRSNSVFFLPPITKPV